jgi:hypothetical protein
MRVQFGHVAKGLIGRTVAVLAWVLLALPQVSAQTPASKPASAVTAKPAAASAPSTKPKGRSTKLKSSASTQYDTKLRELEEKVVGLKERIYKTKTRLLLLKERILNDVIAEAKAIIVHKDEMGPSFQLERVIYHLDGDKIYYQDDTSGTLDQKDSFEVYNANLLPGNHVISVEMTYRGDSSVFTYLKGYVFKLRANFTFYATKGKITRVESVGYKKGDITWELTKRPSITFRVRQTSYSKNALERGSAPKARKR